MSPVTAASFFMARIPAHSAKKMFDNETNCAIIAHRLDGYIIPFCLITETPGRPTGKQPDLMWNIGGGCLYKR